MTLKAMREADHAPPSHIDRAICRVWPFVFILAIILVGLPRYLIALARQPRPRSAKSRSQIFFGAAFPVIAPITDWWYRPHKIPLLKQAHGIVLDIGTGTGANLKYLVPKQISKLVIVEPNPGMWPKLREAVREAGFREGQYVLCDCGAEEEEILFQKAEVKKGDVDTVTSILALCSIPDSQKVIASLYSYLKPGGEFLFLEHVSSDDKGTQRFQRRLNPLWRRLFAGCELTRQTDKWITEPYDWDEVSGTPCLPANPHK